MCGNPVRIARWVPFYLLTRTGAGGQAIMAYPPGGGWPSSFTLPGSRRKPAPLTGAVPSLRPLSHGSEWSGPWGGAEGNTDAVP